MCDQAGEILPKESVYDHHEGDDRQRPAHQAAARFKNQQNQDHAHDNVDRVDRARALGEFRIHNVHIRTGYDRAEHEDKVIERRQVCALFFAVRRLDHKRQYQHDREVYRSLPDARENSELRRIEVKECQQRSNNRKRL